MARVLDRYDARALYRLLADAGVVELIGARGFHETDVEVAVPYGGLSHARVWATKHKRVHMLIDVCLTSTCVEPERLAASGHAPDRAIELLVIYWLREQDPTAVFPSEHPRLPLQDHPGLGVLRRAFEVPLHMAAELRLDGVANAPKFYHDAAIYHHERMFLFLDGAEQGRFEALMRDLAGLSLLDATLAVAGWAVRDLHGDVVRWMPGFQVFPTSPVLADYFNATAYGDRVGTAAAETRYVVDRQALAAARRTYQVWLERSRPG